MKKLSALACLVLGLTATPHAQLAFKGLGWDGNARQIVGRLGINSTSHLEGGIGLFFDGAESGNKDQKDAASEFSLSVRYLHGLHTWEKLTGYLHLGLYFDEDAGKTGALYLQNGQNNDPGFAALVGYQPEIVLFDHLAVSTILGVALPVAPDFRIGTVGQGISIVEGLNFRILF